MCHQGFGLVVRAVMSVLGACHGFEPCHGQKHGTLVERVGCVLIIHCVSNFAPLTLGDFLVIKNLFQLIIKIFFW